MPKKTPTLALRSLYCAAFLLTQGHKLLGFEMIDSRNGNFIFLRDTSIESDLALFHDSGRETKVAINVYLQHFRQLRDLVMAEKRAANQPV